MPDYQARTSANRQRVEEFLRRELPEIMAGTRADPYGLRKAVFAKVLAAALKDVKEDFERKSQGNQGDDGVQWDPLAEYTIKKRSETQKGQSGRAGKDKPTPPPDFGWLSSQRREVYRKEYRRLRLAGLPPKEAAKQAAVIAKAVVRKVWQVMGEAGGRGVPGRPGASVPGDFPILNETGTLLRSASPGTVSGVGLATNYKPEENQEVEYGRGFVAVHSTVPYGEKHQHDGEGEDTGGFRPARPWMYGSEFPQKWLERWTQVMRDSLAEVLADLLPKL